MARERIPRSQVAEVLAARYDALAEAAKGDPERYAAILMAKEVQIAVIRNTLAFPVDNVFHIGMRIASAAAGAIVQTMSVVSPDVRANAVGDVIGSMVGFVMRDLEMLAKTEKGEGESDEIMVADDPEGLN
jgi:hypothetical protein